MNDNLIERAERLLASITPGPWEACYQPSDTIYPSGTYAVVTGGFGDYVCGSVDDQAESYEGPHAPFGKDAEFIAAAPEITRSLLAEVKRLREWKQLHSADVLSVRNEQAEVEEQRDDALAEVKRLRDVMDELTDVLFVPTDEIVDAVRRRLTPRVIETESELREFRIGTLIRDPRGRVWQRILGDEWVALGRLSAPDHVPLPARLLYAPEGGDL